jgi:hypothetical protein
MFNLPSFFSQRRHSIGLLALTWSLAGLVACTHDGSTGQPDRGPASFAAGGAMGPGGADGGSRPPPPTQRFTTPATVISTASTQDVACAYDHKAFNTTPSVNAVSEAHWSCGDSQRTLSANGVPDHEVGVFPNPGNPNKIEAGQVEARFTLAPSLTDRTTQLGGPAGMIGVVLNGVKIDAGTNGGCSDKGECSEGRPMGQWRIEAMGQSSFDFGVDSNNAHVQPGGAYHYHGMPEGFVALQGKGEAMTLIGWAADGFPIYARYGHSDANDAASAIAVMKGSYRLKTTPDANRPAVSAYALGTFQQDYEYVAGYGDLDECNGRTGVTPEFPQGIYHYYATDSYPYFQRCVKGAVSAAARPPRRS